MITKVSEANSSDFQARLAALNAALAASGSSLHIDSLESYFANIQQIAPLTVNYIDARTNQREPGRFLLIPTDEPLFEINANSRTITVPADFSRNGVAVRGDHKAEMLYFSIDRYFDAKDLYTVKDIIINWQFRPANSSAHVDTELHTSQAFAPDETYIPGKIVFGWMIDANMTPARGTLTFSIGFVTYDATGYQYALFTRPATITVNDSLALESPASLSSLSQSVADYLINSAYTPEGVEPPKQPIFTMGENAVSPGITTEPAAETNSKYPNTRFVNFQLNGGVEAETVTLKTHAKSDAPIVYTWTGHYYSAPSTNIAFPDSEVMDYFKISDSRAGSPEPDVLYYEKYGNNFNQLTPTDAADRWNDSEAIMYIGGDIQTLSEAGSVVVSAQARKSVVQGTDILYANSASTQSELIVAPVAAVPKVELSISDTFDVTTHTGVGLYTLPTGNAKEYVYLEGDTNPEITYTITVDDEATNDPDHGLYEGESSLGLVVAQLDNATFNDVSTKAVANGGILTTTATPVSIGEHVAYVYNERNHSSNISAASNVVKTSRVATDLSDAINVYWHNGTPADKRLIAQSKTEQDNGVLIESMTEQAVFYIGLTDTVLPLDKDEKITYNVFEIKRDAYDSFYPDEYLPINEMTADLFTQYKDAELLYEKDGDQYNKIKTGTYDSETKYYLANDVAGIRETARKAILAEIRTYLAETPSATYNLLEFDNAEDQLPNPEVKPFEVITNNNQAQFTIVGDPGRYVVYAKTTYHGSNCETVTEPFRIYTAG